MPKTPRQKNHREANNEMSRFGLKIRLAVTFVLGLVVYGVADKYFSSDADQPKQPEIADTISPGTDGDDDPDGEGDGPKPPKKPDEKEYECPEFTGDEIIEMAEGIKKVRSDWEQFTREPKSEPKVLSPQELKDVLEDVLGDALDKESYDRMIELLDTEEILREAENSGSEAIEYAVTMALKDIEELKNRISATDDRFERIKIFAEFLCDINYGFKSGYSNVLERIEYFHDEDLNVLENENWSEVERRVAGDKEIIDNNPVLKRFVSQEILDLLKNLIFLFDIDSANYDNDCFNYIINELYYRKLREEDEEQLNFSL